MKYGKDRDITALAALAQENRLDVFRLLVQVGPEGLAAGAVADRLSLAPNTLSFHFDRLRQAGLVSCKREGRSLIYAARFETMNGLLAYLTENCCGGVAGGCAPVECAPAVRRAGPGQRCPHEPRWPIRFTHSRHRRRSCGSRGRGTSDNARRPGEAIRVGRTVAANVRDWGHVRLFSPWRFNTDAAATAILREHGWQSPPADALPTGGDLYAAYLQPLAGTPILRPVIETGARVRNVSRQGIDKVVSRGRGDHPYALAIDQGNGGSRIDLARAVIDASGTWTNPNPASASGTTAIGETALADHIAYGIPDVLGRDCATYTGRTVLVVGGGHSAANVLIDLARLAETDARLKIIWAVRSDNLAGIFGMARRQAARARQIG